MDVPTTAMALDRPAACEKSRFFLVTAIALFTAGLAAALRASVASDLQRIFLDPIDKAHSTELIGTILGVARSWVLR